MTDAHCHVPGGDPAVREFLIGRDFAGIHPWDACPEPEGLAEDAFAALRSRLLADPRLGVGEIGLDRLKVREISPRMREVFARQLRLADEFRRPVVLHGAKCWGQVVETIRRQLPRTSVPAFLFHGFSRSDGLIPDIVALNGFISVGPAILNDHAVNYRALVKKIPIDRLLLETDRTQSAGLTPDIRAVAAKVAEVRGVTCGELERLTDENADRFVGDLWYNMRPS